MRNSMGNAKLVKILKEHLLDEHCVDYNRLLQIIQTDKTLDLEMSENHCILYYRGGGIIVFGLDKNNTVTLSLDNEYLSDEFLKAEAKSCDKDASWWISNLPRLKASIDGHKAISNRYEEEAKQVLTRENNYLCCPKHKEGNQCIAVGTDYYIADVEYPISEDKPDKRVKRIDCLAIHLPSSVSSRKKMNCDLAIVEMKYGTKAAGSGKEEKATIHQHIIDLHNSVFNNEKAINPDEVIINLQADAKTALTTKFDLGLICVNKPFEHLSFSNKQIQYILVLANYKPAYIRTNLLPELEKTIALPEYAALKKYCSFFIAQSSSMGYALYKDCMISFEQFIEK